MLGIYAGIFLLLLITVLTCALYSCGSVSRALPGPLQEGRLGQVWARGAREEKVMSLPWGPTPGWP